MKHRLVLLAALFFPLAVSPAVAASIEAEVNAVMQDRVMRRATLGVQVMRLGNSPADLQEVYNRNAHVPLIPASNLKLVTAAAALQRLGPDFKFRTLLLLRGQDLLLVGDGDPTFGDPAYLKKFGWKATAVFDGWVAQLQKLGVTSVRDLLVDDSIFDDNFFHPDWPLDQIDAYYEAQVGGMNYYANLADVWFPGGGREPVTTPATRYIQFKMTPQSGRSLSVNRQPGTNVILVRGEVPSSGVRTYVTVHDPSLYAGSVLAELTTAGGIKTSGAVKRDLTIRKQDPAAQAAAGKWTIVGVHETPLAAVITRMNKDSVNFYAEALCKRMGFDADKGASGDWQNGGAATAAYLKSVGIPETDFTLADGCGLSRKNEISPRALVRVLCAEFYGKNREAYIASLSVAGVDGTLDDRFKGSDLRKRVFGKSGFIEGVSAVTGYLQAKDGQWYAFAVMVNGIPRLSNGEVKLLQERIVKAVDAEVSKK